METKGPGGQKPTGMRKLPGAAPAPAPAAQAAAPSRPGLRPRPGGAPGAAGAPARKPLSSRPPAPEKKGGSGGKIFIVLLLLVGGGVAAGYFIKDKEGQPIIKPYLAKIGLGDKEPKVAEKPKPEHARKSQNDLAIEAAAGTKVRAQAYLSTDLKRYADEPALVTAESSWDVYRALDAHKKNVAKANADLGKATGVKPEDIEAGKKLETELGELVAKWKELADKKKSETDAAKPEVAKVPDPKPDPVKPEPDKPEPEKPKVDPTKEPERPPVASGKPVPSGKPVEKPKEEPKPEPEKPKPEKPKPEPEKPKEEPKKPEPKPEPEKPKEEPKAEPEKPKPEPEKPKEEPKKPEPKPEPEKPKEEPKPEPKPEPAKPKVETVLAGADEKVKDGAQLYSQLGEAMKNLPDDAEKLKTLLMKKEAAQELFTKARETYLSVKETAPDPSKLEKRLGQIEVVLARLQKYEEEIKSKLK